MRTGGHVIDSPVGQRKSIDSTAQHIHTQNLENRCIGANNDISSCVHLGPHGSGPMDFHLWPSMEVLWSHRPTSALLLWPCCPTSALLFWPCPLPSINTGVSFYAPKSKSPALYKQTNTDHFSSTSSHLSLPATTTNRASPQPWPAAKAVGVGEATTEASEEEVVGEARVSHQRHRRCHRRRHRRPIRSPLTSPASSLA
jgi:hypothetical protein